LRRHGEQSDGNCRQNPIDGDDPREPSKQEFLRRTRLSEVAVVDVDHHKTADHKKQIDPKVAKAEETPQIG
jgi:hypothetical protein